MQVSNLDGEMKRKHWSYYNSELARKQIRYDASDPSLHISKILHRHASYESLLPYKSRKWITQLTTLGTRRERGERLESSRYPLFFCRLHSVFEHFRCFPCAAMAMSMAVSVMGMQVQALTQLRQAANVTHSPAPFPLFSSQSTVSFSGLNGAPLRSKSFTGRRMSSRLSIDAVVSKVDIAKVIPQADRVLVRLEKLAEQSAGGVLLPKSAVKFERYLVGEIIAAGSEATTLEKGQKVMFSDISAYEVNLGTEDKLCFCRVGDLLAIIE